MITVWIIASLAIFYLTMDQYRRCPETTAIWEPFVYALLLPPAAVIVPTGFVAGIIGAAIYGVFKAPRD